MASKPTGINNKIDLTSCILIAVGTFFISTILIGVVGVLLVGLINPGCWESCPLMIIALSPWIGGIIAIIAGIVGGQKAYNNLKKMKEASEPIKNLHPEEEIDKKEVEKYGIEVMYAHHVTQ